MPPITYQYTQGQRKTLLAPKVYSGGQVKEIAYAWLYTGGRKELVFSRTPVDFTAPVLSWNSVALAWTPPGLTPDSYTLKRTAPDTATLLSNSQLMNFTDTNRLPGTTYSYLVEAWYQGAVLSSDNVTVTTPARGSMDLSVTAVTWQSLTLNWVDPAGGATGYRIYQDGVVIVNSQAAKTLNVTGLSEKRTYVFKVAALSGSTEVGDNSISVTTPARPALVLSAPTVYWDEVTLSWADPGGGQTGYRIYRDGEVVVSTQAAKTWTDTVRYPANTYAYKVEARRSGQVIGTGTLDVFTPYRADLGFDVWADNYSTISGSWTDPDQRSIDSYGVWNADVEHLGWFDTATKYFTQGGRNPGQNHWYVLRAYRAGIEIYSADTADADTPARPTSTGTVYGPAIGSGSYWTQSTVQNLSSTNFSLSVTGWATSFNLLISGRGTTGTCNPHLAGVYAGVRDIGSTGSGSPGWSGFNNPTNPDGSNPWYFAASTAYSVGCQTGGASPKASQWKPYDGGGGSTIPWGQINYWYYTSLMRAKAPVNTHIETQLDADGQVVWERVTDKTTGKVLDKVTGRHSSMVDEIGGDGG